METPEGNMDESMADLVNAYRGVAGKDVAKIAMGIGDGRNGSDEASKRSEFSENASKLLKELTDHVNKVMFQRQAEYANSSDMLFALAEANRSAQSSAQADLEPQLKRLFELAKRKNGENRENGVGNAIDDSFLMSIEDLLRKRSRERWIPING